MSPQKSKEDIVISLISDLKQDNRNNFKELKQDFKDTHIELKKDLKSEIDKLQDKFEKNSIDVAQIQVLIKGIESYKKATAEDLKDLQTQVGFNSSGQSYKKGFALSVINSILIIFTVITSWFNR